MTGAPSDVRIVDLEAAHLDALQEFLARMPEGDLTFVKERVDEPAVLRAWVDTGTHAGTQPDTHAGTQPGTQPDRARRWVALADDGRTILGFAAVLPLLGWSGHVGELRLIVSPDARGRGLGRALAQHALREAVALGVCKVQVEVIAVQEATIAMFNALGFRAEALLQNHIRDRQGDLQDLVLLAHEVDEQWAAMDATGVTDALG